MILPEDASTASAAWCRVVAPVNELRRSWDPRLPPLPATPRRQDPHHEERDEDDQEEPGTVTVIERDLRLLGRVSQVDVGRAPRSGGRVSSVSSAMERSRLAGPTSELPADPALRTVTWSAVSCRRVVGPGYERPYGSSHALARIPGGAVPAYHGGAPLILTLERSSWTKNLKRNSGSSRRGPTFAG